MIFSYFDPISYTAKTINPSSSSISMTDIFKNYREYFNRVIVNFQLKTYYISGSPRPEELSYILYNNSQYYWVLLMVNNIYDPYHGWVESQNSSYESSTQRYADVGGEHVLYHIDENGDKYWNLTEFPSNSSVWYDKGDEEHLYPQYYGALAAVDTYEDAIRRNEEKRQIKIIDPGDMDSFISALIKEMEKS